VVARHGAPVTQALPGHRAGVARKRAAGRAVTASRPASVTGGLAGRANPLIPIGPAYIAFRRNAKAVNCAFTSVRNHHEEGQDDYLHGKCRPG
jgi:hypothetical protein